MKIIVCLDDQNGMMFNKRRVSQDVVVREDIMKNLNNKHLFMNRYSYEMFQKDGDCENIINVDHVPIINDEYQFIEDQALLPYQNQISQLIVYYWNRRYPSDIHFDIDLMDGKWKMILEENMVGKSHEKITKRIYEKAED